jgi:hypothetical protein
MLRGAAVTTRARVVELARGEIGLSDAGKYWRDVLGPSWVGPYPKHWCGAFALWCLRQAGLTDWQWQVGKGFLSRLPQTRRPEPGDMGYVDQPFQHHFVVTEVDRHTIGSVDGNQGTPGVQARSRATGKHTYFSIAGLLRDTVPQMPALRHPTLRLGTVGADVAVLQAMLNSYQNAGLTEDGAFGPKTARAVQTFQRDRGLDADGVVGPKTWAELERAT